MKIFKYIRIDMETLEVEEEVSYDYHGPISLCEGGGAGDGGDGGGLPDFSEISDITPPSEFGTPAELPGDMPELMDLPDITPPSEFGERVDLQADNEAREKDVQKTDKMLSALGKGFATIFGFLGTITGNPALAAGGAAVGGLLNKFSEEAARFMVANPSMKPAEAVESVLDNNNVEIQPEVRESIANYTENVMGKDAQLISQMAVSQEYKGALTPEEYALLDEIEQRQIDIFSKTINERVTEYAQGEIARLVDRGVLQGDIGSTALSKIYEAGAEEIGRGTTEIQTERMKNELSLIQGQKELSFQESESAKRRALESSIAKMEKEAAEKASQWGAWGNLASGLLFDDSDWGWEDLF